MFSIRSTIAFGRKYLLFKNEKLVSDTVFSTMQSTIHFNKCICYSVLIIIKMHEGQPSIRFLFCLGLAGAVFWIKIMTNRCKNSLFESFKYPYIHVLRT